MVGGNRPGAIVAQEKGPNPKTGAVNFVAEQSIYAKVDFFRRPL